MSEAWPIESIPDADLLFMRIHRNNIVEGKPVVGVFINRGEGAQEGMSTDWSKYSTAEQTRLRAQNPAWKGGVIQMVVGDVRKLPRQTVEHSPLPDNRSHTNVKGPKKESVESTQIRYLFMRIWKWAIEYEGVEPASTSI